MIGLQRPIFDIIMLRDIYSRKIWRNSSKNCERSSVKEAAAN
jgi:hypothetical protein